MAVVEYNQRRGGACGVGFCCAPHPTNPDVWCRRLPHDDDDHSAFVFSIPEPEHWQEGPPF